MEDNRGSYVGSGLVIFFIFFFTLFFSHWWKLNIMITLFSTKHRPHGRVEFITINTLSSFKHNSFDTFTCFDIQLVHDIFFVPLSWINLKWIYQFTNSISLMLCEALCRVFGTLSRRITLYLSNVWIGGIASGLFSSVILCIFRGAILSCFTWFLLLLAGICTFKCCLWWYLHAQQAWM